MTGGKRDAVNKRCFCAVLDAVLCVWMHCNHLNKIKHTDFCASGKMAARCLSSLAFLQQVIQSWDCIYLENRRLFDVVP